METEDTRELFYIAKTSAFTNAKVDDFLSVPGLASSPRYVPLHKDLEKAALALVFSAARHGNSDGQWDSHRQFHQDKWPLPNIFIMKVEVDSSSILDLKQALPKEVEHLSHHLKWLGSVEPGLLITADGRQIHSNTATATAQLEFQSIITILVQELAEHLHKKHLAGQIRLVQNKMDIYKADVQHFSTKVAQTQQTLEQLHQQRSLEDIYEMPEGILEPAPLPDANAQSEPSTSKRHKL